MAGDDMLAHHKLCGFLRAVVSAASPPPPQPGTPCTLHRDGNSVVFLPRDGAPLVILPESSDDGGDGDGDNAVVAPRKRRRRGAGIIHGNISVVRQIHTLVVHKCLRVDARVVGVVGTRVVVLVDVYLPIAAWSGWQFPKHRALAAAVFKHVSCDWEAKNSFVSLEWNSDHLESGSIWSVSDCHVLGCNMHCSSSCSSKQRSYNLHEIFKSLPCLGKEEKVIYSRIQQEDASLIHGIWDVADDILILLLSTLRPKDLVRVAATCRHLRSLAASVMPCMKLKLFSHQEVAVEWMLKRERKTEILPHPLFINLLTEDGFSFYVNVVSGEISTGTAPMVNDFRGGLFCDEPGLGKTVTALSLILKTYDTLAEPPCGADVVWCMHNSISNRKCGYYELSADTFTPGNLMSTCKRFVRYSGRKEKMCSSKSTDECTSIGEGVSSPRKRCRIEGVEHSLSPIKLPGRKSNLRSSEEACSQPQTRILRCTRSSSSVKKILVNTFDADSGCAAKRIADGSITGEPCRFIKPSKKPRKVSARNIDFNEIWVQCDACRKWRKLTDKSVLDAGTAWFCSMNTNPLYQSCAAPEEHWDCKQKITYLPGFYSQQSDRGNQQNVSFFTSVLKDHHTLFDFHTKKALTWLVNLPEKALSDMETIGLIPPMMDDKIVLHGETIGYHKIFQAFGLVRKIDNDTSRWYYPPTLESLSFDLSALRIALTRPFNLFRLYLSRATLVVVPANLVDHWRTQIEKHVSHGQLCVCVWTDNRKPSAHCLAWDYDVVITTFNRLSAEWSLRKRSILMQVHWFRVILDEGHTLGSSLSITNKLQIAISLAASNRWIFTGTPTPNTPNSQASHLQPLLKFLHEEAYGLNQYSWEAGILRPFQTHMEEGRTRLVELLRRIMISARKADLKNIPPCIRKVTYLYFTEEHAKSYNELVLTVRRNILMADWNDPSHVESLLNPKQWKFRGNTIRNVRLSCCVAGHIKVTDAGQDIQETMDILVQQGLDPLSDDYMFIKISLLDGCSCFRCKDWCRLPVITPCMHLLCLDCVALDRTKCTFPGCGYLYEMQNPEKLKRPENPNPKWPVPKDLIELQPSYKQDDWHPDWDATSTSKVAYLVERLKELQECGGQASQSGRDAIYYAEALTHKSQYGGPSAKMTNDMQNLLPEKVIVFSQFLEHLNIIEEQLKVAGIKYGGMYSPMHSLKKMKSLMDFLHDSSCMVLLMDGSAALGLDLSFVTHVFLMEPIWDRSMEEQVISRAHRMGATRPIHVETLAMRGTIEEQMLEFLQDADVCRKAMKQTTNKSDQESARTYHTLHDFAESSYLTQLSFVRTNIKV